MRRQGCITTGTGITIRLAAEQFDVADGEMDALAGHKAEVVEQGVSDLHPGDEQLVRPAWEFSRALQWQFECDRLFVCRWTCFMNGLQSTIKKLRRLAIAR